MDVLDPGDQETVQRALEDVKLEIDRRRHVGPSASDADIVVVLRELVDLEPEAMATAAAIGATGPHYGVRRYRNAQIELGTTDITDIDRVRLPANLERIVNDTRSRIGGSTTPAA